MCRNNSSVISKKYIMKKGDALRKSLTYNKNKRGPSMEPWGTAHWTIFCVL